MNLWIQRFEFRVPSRRRRDEFRVLSFCANNFNKYQLISTYFHIFSLYPYTPISHYSSKKKTPHFMRSLLNKNQNLSQVSVNQLISTLKPETLNLEP